MKKNNKGFFLVEVIVVVSLVTSVMAFIYPNLSKLYTEYENMTIYYDQPEDLFLLDAYYSALNSEIKESTCTNSSLCDTNSTPIINPAENTVGCKKFSTADDMAEIPIPDTQKVGDIDKLYITGYLTNASDGDYKFNRYLKRLKKSTNDNSAYRLIGIFKNSSQTRFASIKIDNPNELRTCN